jgi:hypothetical protein
MPSCAALAGPDEPVPPSVVVVTPVASPYRPPRSGQKRAHPLRRLTRRAVAARGKRLATGAAPWRVWGVSSPDAPDALPHREVGVTFSGHATVVTTDDDDLAGIVPGDIVCIHAQTGNLVYVTASEFGQAAAGWARAITQLTTVAGGADYDHSRRCVVGSLVRVRPKSIDVFVDVVATDRL